MDVMRFTVPFVAALFLIVQGKERCCGHVGCFSDEPPFDNMPLPHCLDIIRPRMKMYTRANKAVGRTVTNLTIPPVFNRNKTTVFLVHGYLQGAWVSWMGSMKDAYLRAFDCNVVIVDWFGGSMELWYPQAASNIRPVGKRLAEVAKNLVEAGGTDQWSLWCVGHSLGAHLCGHAGAAFKLGRITGLDPAGPWFEKKNVSVGLNPECAEFVDVIHTHGDGLVLGLGTLKPLGHVDFYPNGGQRQPGCVWDPLSVLSRLSHGGLNPAIACSHARVIDYWIEAVTSDLDGCHFTSQHACYEAYNIPGACFDMKTAVQEMGPNSSNYTTRGAIYLRTNGRSPYCKNE